MATVLRRRILVNPARKRKAKAVRKRRKLTAKQIKFFGTAAQKAALKRRRTAAAKQNPAHRRRRRAARRNVGQIISLALPAANPAGKEKTMARRKKTTARRRRHSTHSKRRANPVIVTKARRYSRRHNAAARRRRNPGVAGKRIPSFVKYGGFTLIGAIGTNYLTKLVLGEKNTGLIGYLGSTVAALVLGQAVKMVAKDPMAGLAVTGGGVAGVIQRVISEQTSYGKYVTLSGMGNLIPANFTSPALTNADGTQVIPPGWAPTVVAGKLSGVGSAYRSGSYR